MSFKLIVLIASVAVTNAGILPAQQLHYSSAPEVSHVYNSYHAPQVLQGASYSDGHLAHGIQQQNIVRTHGGTISQISKQVVSPHSHVSKIDTRINNDGLKTISYAAPALSHGYAAAPAISQGYVAAPVAYKSSPLIAQSHIAAAPLAYSHQQPTIIASNGHGLGHVSYSSPIVNYGW